VELVGISENDRTGQSSRERAELRAVLTAERLIAGKGFAEKLDAYLDSLR
jgi:hypothetical protein